MCRYVQMFSLTRIIYAQRFNVILYMIYHLHYKTALYYIFGTDKKVIIWYTTANIIRWSLEVCITCVCVSDCVRLTWFGFSRSFISSLFSCIVVTYSHLDASNTQQWNGSDNNNMMRQNHNNRIELLHFTSYASVYQNYSVLSLTYLVIRYRLVIVLGIGFISLLWGVNAPYWSIHFNQCVLRPVNARFQNVHRWEYESHYGKLNSFWILLH